MTDTIMATTTTIVTTKIIMEIIFIILLSQIIHTLIYICIEKYKILIIMMEIKNVLVRRSYKGQYNTMREGESNMRSNVPSKEYNTMREGEIELET